MDPRSDFLDKLIESAADGTAINWDEIEKLPADDELRRLLQHLRLVSEVADLHRSHVDDVAVVVEPESVTTGTGRGPRTAGPAVPGLSPAGEARGPSPAGALGRWGHLLLLRKIGEGAFGEVYHAHDTWLDHPVALKLLKPSLASPDFSTRMLHEARKLARVRHPNVVTVHGADSHNGRVGFWMDLVEGQTLAELLSRGRLSPGEAAHIGQEVCLALAAVHQAKLVHRDVKAQNVMRAADGGRIILMDFGAGEFIDAPLAGTRAQGTPLYLAPEILAGNPASVRSDIYAVGVLLYYLVTGGYPVVGSSIAGLAEAHQRGERRRLRDERADLPASFITVVERALAPEAMHRYGSAGEMHAALVGETSTAHLVANGADAIRQPADRTWRRNLERAGLAMAAVVIATGALGFIACRVFEVTLRVNPDFAAGLGKYFTVGGQALFPFVLVWAAGGAACSVVGGLRPLLGSRLHTLRRWTARLMSVNPSILAALIFLLGAGGLLAITWAFVDLFVAIDALSRASAARAADFSILSPAGRSLHRAHMVYSTVLSFVLGLAVWLWFPRIERRVNDPSAARLLKWATAAVAVLVVVMAVLPRRILWEKFEVVVFENQPAFVIGANAEELLLYAPDATERTRWRVPTDAAALRHTGESRQLFEPLRD